MEQWLAYFVLTCLGLKVAAMPVGFVFMWLLEDGDGA